MRPLRRYITRHHGIALSDPRYLRIYLALATLVTTFVSVSTWLVLIFTVFAQFKLQQLGIINQLLAFGGIGIFLDFHRNHNMARLLWATVALAIAIVSAVAWFLGPIVSTVVWLFDIPPLAIFLLGLRSGSIAMGITFMSTGLALKFGVWQPIVGDEVAIMIGHTLNVLGATLMLVLILNFYDSSRRAMQQELGRTNRELEVSSITDRLTGLFNRGKLDQALALELSRSDRNARPLSVILMDLDLFKQINDEFGHSVGDDVLQKVADILRQVGRDIDIVGRWGGEEFMLICTDTTLEGAIALAERLRAMVASYVFPEVGHKTASMGVSSYRVGDNSRSLLVRADNALYRAKDAGRNQVQSEESTP